MASWYPGGGGEFTAEPEYPVIYVYDSCVNTIGPLRQESWVKARDAALAQWAVSGLRFEVEVKDYLWETDFDDGLNHDQEILAQLDRKSVVLRRHDGLTRTGQGSYISAYGDIEYHVGLAEFDIKKYNYLVQADRRAIIAHEVGHTLGFGHGGLGVMNWGYDPNASRDVSVEELAAAKSYYRVN